MTTHMEHESDIKKTKYLIFRELIFREIPNKPKLKTKVISVLNRRSGSALGYIQWYVAWRQYTFQPRPLTVFNTDCLKDICEVINDLMKARKTLMQPSNDRN